MIAKEIIRKKRDGKELSRREISWLVSGITNGELSDSQVGALAMAIFFSKMTLEERISLTEAMRDSGKPLEWRFNGPSVDKHSTGGIGDNVSLILAPTLAACGCYVPMISGRALGHTGGTLDKFDSIPGYNTKPDIGTFRKVVEDVGCAIVGQTSAIAPADKRLYSIRDTTGTVESIDLITSSILSKKLSVRLDALVLDVKCGNGAFMKTESDARHLANALVEVSNMLNCSTSAFLTDMSQPLCKSVGNSLEVSAAINFLVSDEIDKRLLDVVCATGGKLLVLAGIALNSAEGERKILQSIVNGSAAEVFARMVSHLGGPTDIIEAKHKYLRPAAIVKDIFLPEAGFVYEINSQQLGLALIELGGGRRKEEDRIDYSVGFDKLKSIGDRVDDATPVARVHAPNHYSVEVVKKIIHSSYKVCQEKRPETPVVLEIIEQ